MEPGACTTPYRVWLGEGALKGQLLMGMWPVELREYTWGLSVVSDAFPAVFLLGRWISSGLLQVMESLCLGKPKSYIEEGFAQRFSKIRCFIS